MLAITGYCLGVTGYFQASFTEASFDGCDFTFDFALRVDDFDFGAMGIGIISFAYIGDFYAGVNQNPYYRGIVSLSAAVDLIGINDAVNMTGIVRASVW